MAEKISHAFLGSNMLLYTCPGFELEAQDTRIWRKNILAMLPLLTCLNQMKSLVFSGPAVMNLPYDNCESAN